MKVKLVRKTVEIVEIVTDDSEGVVVDMSPGLIGETLSLQVRSESSQSYLKNVFDANKRPDPVGFENHDL